ncbi:MAG: hypothetical protein ACREE0_16645 [Phenylobacterium sp.]
MSAPKTCPVLPPKAKREVRDAIATSWAWHCLIWEAVMPASPELYLHLSPPDGCPTKDA